MRNIGSTSSDPAGVSHRMGSFHMNMPGGLSYTYREAVTACLECARLPHTWSTVTLGLPLCCRCAVLQGVVGSCVVWCDVMWCRPLAFSVCLFLSAFPSHRERWRHPSTHPSIHRYSGFGSILLRRGSSAQLQRLKAVTAETVPLKRYRRNAEHRVPAFNGDFER